MKRKTILWALMVLVLTGMTNCNKSSQKSTTNECEEQQHKQFPDLDLAPEIRARLDAMDTTIVFPEWIENDEEKIFYIENLVLSSPVSPSELLALRPIHDLDPQEENYNRMSDRMKDAVRMANQFMRMQYVARSLEPEDELQWAVAVKRMLTKYAEQYDTDEDQALQDLLISMGHLECGTQRQINQYTYIASSVEYYRTIAAYRDWLTKAPLGMLDMFTEEFVAWVRMNNARHSAYVNIRRAGCYYSALPMEYEGMFAAYARRRMDMLQAEVDVLRKGKTYMQQHPLVRTADWNNYLTDKLHISDEDDPEAYIAREVDRTVNEWLQIRQEIAKYLPKDIGKYYDNITADYHWMITNEDEDVPLDYM